MLNLSQFVGPAKTPGMKVNVIGEDGQITKTFTAPEGFQLERYVDALYPQSEFMVYNNAREVNVSVIVADNIIEVYQGLYK